MAAGTGTLAATRLERLPSSYFPPSGLAVVRVRADKRLMVVLIVLLVLLFLLFGGLGLATHAFWGLAFIVLAVIVVVAIVRRV